MDGFWKAVAVVLISVILGLCLERYGKASAVLLTLFAVAMIAALAAVVDRLMAALLCLGEI